jgi:DNA-binding NarL/FixJ family response regulator
VRVLLVDDNKGILERAAAALEPLCVIVGTARDGRAALTAVESLRPDVVVLDISMPGMSGLEVASALRAAEPASAIVFLTVHDDAEVVRAANDAGALGYVVKRRLGSDLLCAVQEARAGRRFTSVMP